MARAKSERTRSKAAAIEDLTQSLEQLQAILPKIEDLGREGFPYIEGARSRTELQIRECIKRAFGERSPEYQTHRHHKLSLGSPSETKQTLALLKTLITTLEEKKLELQGLKPAPAEEPPATTPTSPARPQMTLVPPTAPMPQVTIASIAPVAPQPVTTVVPLATNVDTAPPHAAVATVQEAAPAVPPPPIVQAAPAPVAQMAPPPVPSAPATQSTTPISAAASFRPQDTGSVAPQPQAAPPRFSATQEVRVPAQAVPPTATPPPAPAAIVPPQLTRTQEIRLQSQAPAASGSPPAPRQSPSPEFAHLDLAKKLCQRFHAVARQLRLRGEYRTTLEIGDEIDAQDLLHALLRLQFDDIGTDEWTPSYTNGTPRTTFFLNHDRLAIVVKKTRTGLSPKELVDQMRVDIERYRTRERCTQLLCFIYDPEGRIGNPRGLESDLTTVSDTFTVDVIVAPK